MEELASMLIHGIQIILFDHVETGTDTLGRPIFEEIRIPVDNVIPEPMSDQEIADSMDLTGRKATYRLCLPKGDTHDWIDRDVEFFGKRWHTVGEPLEWVEDMVPLEWNKKVRVERING
ncbi:MAG: hypothetical protein IKD62_02900 [Oscillospiraceae bacterium]|nr:hypothetical protein [Oscillospiraceae bacterium]